MSDPHKRTADRLFGSQDAPAPETHPQDAQETPAAVYRRRKQAAIRVVFEAVYGPQEARDGD